MAFLDQLRNSEVGRARPQPCLARMRRARALEGRRHSKIELRATRTRAGKAASPTLRSVVAAYGWAAKQATSKPAQWGATGEPSDRLLLS